MNKKKYLQLSEEDPNDIELIFSMLIAYLDTIHIAEFDFEECIGYSGIVSKFIKVIRRENADLSYIEEDIHSFEKSILRLRNINNVINSEVVPIKKTFWWSTKKDPEQVKLERIQHRNELMTLVESSHFKVYSEVIRLYSEFAPKPEKVALHLEGFFDPNLSNKKTAHEILENAINLIQQNEDLSQKTKDKIVSHLKNALEELNKPRPNWTKIFGTLKETAFVLGAIGSLVSGISAAATINEAKAEIEKATEIIQQTSVNVNYNNINTIFDLSETVLIEDSKKIELLPAKDDQLRKSKPKSIDSKK